MSREPASLTRCLGVWAAASLVAMVLLTWLLPHLGAALAVAPPAARFDEWLVLGCEAAAALGSAWLWLLVGMVALEATGRAPRRHRGVPRVVRRLVLAACGVGLLGGLVGPAHATPPPSPLAGLPLPDRPTSHAVDRPGGRPRLEPRAAARQAPERPGSVRVVRGDSLWALAVDDLPGDATLAEVDARWHAIHEANRGVIGTDPDLILPGQQLRLPPPAPSSPAT